MHRELFELFDHVITGDTVKDGKPCPEIFQKALSKFGQVDPASVLVFEDAPLGVEAALAARMNVVSDVYFYFLKKEKCLLLFSFS
jgi:HAD superfamily hydrolase (TIGR01509 family)